MFHIKGIGLVLIPINHWGKLGRSPQCDYILPSLRIRVLKHIGFGNRAQTPAKRSGPDPCHGEPIRILRDPLISGFPRKRISTSVSRPARSPQRCRLPRTRGQRGAEAHGIHIRVPQQVPGPRPPTSTRAAPSRVNRTAELGGSGGSGLRHRPPRRS